MDGSCNEISRERMHGARVDRNIFTFEKFEEETRVSGCVFNGGVTGYGGERVDAEPIALERKEYGERIVDSGIGINDGVDQQPKTRLIPYRA